MFFISDFTRKMSFVVIFRPGTVQIGFFSSETSETGFFSSGRKLAFFATKPFVGFSSP